MSDEIGEVIATNLNPDPRMTGELPGGVNVTQDLQEGGGLRLSLAVTGKDGYVRPWADVQTVDESVCVLIVLYNKLTPQGGASLTTDSGELVWLRGGAGDYGEVMAVRAADVRRIRLHAPVDGSVRLFKSGCFGLDSWEEMQKRGIIYFDGAGIIQASESGYTLPPATTSTLGGVIVGDGLAIDAAGHLSALVQDLPIATQDTAGVIKIGQGLRAQADGTVGVKLGSGLEYDGSGNIVTTDDGGSSVDLSDFYTRDQTDGKFLTKEVAEATYATKEELDQVSGGADLTNYYDKTESDDRYLQKKDYREPAADYDGNIGSGTLFVKQGIVTLTFYGVSLSSGSATTSISGSIPSAYRPGLQVVFAMGTNTGKSARGSVSTSGGVSITKMDNDSATSAFGSCSWGCSA